MKKTGWVLLGWIFLFYVVGFGVAVFVVPDAVLRVAALWKYVFG